MGARELGYLQQPVSRHSKPSPSRSLEKNRPPHSACTYATPLVNPDESVRAGAGVVGAGPRTTLTEREIQERCEAGEQTHSTYHQRGGSR